MRRTTTASAATPLLTERNYIRIMRLTHHVQLARLHAEIARVQAERAGAELAGAMRAHGLDPAVEHEYNDVDLTITPCLSSGPDPA